MALLEITEASRLAVQEDRAQPSAVPMMDLPRFLRLFQMRTNQIMWLFGAGTSRSAGIKTAWDMIWDFKQKLYCSQKKVPLSAITDLSDPAVQRALQAHFDSVGGFPAAGSEIEYSGYFEATYPSPKDRRSYLDTMLAGAKPSFGHRALGLLFQEDLTRIVRGPYNRRSECLQLGIFGRIGGEAVYCARRASNVFSNAPVDMQARTLFGAPYPAS